MKQRDLLGWNEDETHSWNDGIIASTFRLYAQDHSTKKKWVILDGPLDS